MWTYTTGGVAEQAFGWNPAEGTQTDSYQAAGNWVGLLFAVQAIGSVIWAAFIPRFNNHKFIYALSLIIGGVGFISSMFFTDKYLLFISFFMVGAAWAAMLALPFTILTNSISGRHMGTYLGLFNGTITIPQIVAAALGGVVFSLVGGGAHHQINMIGLAGVLLIVGAFCVFFIKETYAETIAENKEHFE